MLVLIVSSLNKNSH